VRQAATKHNSVDSLDDQVGLRSAAFGGGPARSDLAVTGLAVLGAAAAATITLTGGVAPQPTLAAAVLVANIVILAVAGLLWRHGRPSSALGTLLLAQALLIGLSSLAGSPTPGVYLVGIFAGWVAAIGATWLVVAFPGVRPRGAAWTVLGLAGATIVLGELPMLFTSSAVHSLPAVGRCVADCPANAARIVDAPGVATAFRHVEAGLQALWGAAFLVYMALHFLRASNPRRRVLAPMYLVTAPFVVLFAVNGFVSEVAGYGNMGLSTALASARIAAPLGFIAALLFAGAYAGAALAYMTGRLIGQPSLAAVEQLVRRVLDDAQAQLAFWSSPYGRFVDRHGRPVSLDPADRGRSWRSFPHGGEPVLAIVHDSVLGEDTELVEAAGAAAMLAVENRRLQEHLVDSVQALRASQQRLVTASSSERRKIERDLHDGLQQTLVALRIHLELAQGLAEEGSGLSRRLASLSAGFDEALEELRALAHGIYPPLLSEEGLAAALREAARRSTVPLSIGVEDVGRLSEECETAVYYCCLEALQNVAKHAGDDAVAELRLWRDGRAVCFAVVDDGVGFVPNPGRGDVGLTNMADRIGAVGGSLVIRSEPGEGATVQGRVTAQAPEPVKNHLLRV
jgi:signal transduction histidine kinase